MATPELNITEMEQSQSQKHVTFNEAMFKLDAATQLAVIDRGLNTPPGSPAEGDRYIVASGATGDWTGAEDLIAVYQNAGWVFLTPRNGWKAFVLDEAIDIRYNGSAWNTVVSGAASTANGAFTQFEIASELLAGLSGASVTTTVAFPNQCIILGVSVYVVDAITGATDYDVGDGSTQDRFGGSLGIATGSNNQGLIGPLGNYGVTTVTLTSNGGSFTAGDVRVGLHYIATGAATS